MVQPILPSEKAASLALDGVVVLRGATWADYQRVQFLDVRPNIHADREFPAVLSSR